MPLYPVYASGTEQFKQRIVTVGTIVTLLLLCLVIDNPSEPTSSAIIRVIASFLIFPLIFLQPINAGQRAFLEKNGVRYLDGEAHITKSAVIMAVVLGFVGLGVAYLPPTLIHLACLGGICIFLTVLGYEYGFYHASGFSDHEAPHNDLPADMSDGG